jgi:ribosomal protein L19E
MRLVCDHVSTPNDPETDKIIMHAGWPEAVVHTRGRHRAENKPRPIKIHAPQAVGARQGAQQPLSPSNSRWVAKIAGARAGLEYVRHARRLSAPTQYHRQLHRMNYATLPVHSHSRHPTKLGYDAFSERHPAKGQSR